MEEELRTPKKRKGSSKGEFERGPLKTNGLLGPAGNKN